MKFLCLVSVVLSLGLVFCNVDNNLRADYERITGQVLENGDKSLPNFVHPTNVKVGIYVSKIEVDLDRYVLGLKGYLRQSWQDPRLVFPATEDGFTKVNIPFEDQASLWKPDTFHRHVGVEVYKEPTPQFLMKVNATGHVWYVYGFGMEIDCVKPANPGVKTFVCPLMFESFGHTSDQMYFSWLPSPVDLDPNVPIPGVVLNDKILYDCSQTYTAGTFTCLEIQFLFEKE